MLSTVQYCAAGRSPVKYSTVEHSLELAVFADWSGSTRKADMDVQPLNNRQK